MHSHHSHSGDYVAHGVDPLEDIITEVKRRQFHTWCLTEHMPRLQPSLLYPEEVRTADEPEKDLARLVTQFESFLDHAQRIKERESFNILIGMEIEGCNAAHLEHAKALLSRKSGILQFMVGSVHHVHDIPIDFDQTMWNQAIAKTGNNIKQLLVDYFTLQRKMLESVKPLIVGHFDLIRLYMPVDLLVDKTSGKIISEKDEVVSSKVENVVTISSIDSIMTLWPEVKDLIIGNLQYACSYGAALELNSSGLRKGLIDPYPHRDIVGLAKKVTADLKYVMSDDAHAVSQVGVCYDKLLNYMENVVKMDKVSYLAEMPNGQLEFKDISLEELKKAPFWTTFR